MKQQSNGYYNGVVLDLFKLLTNKNSFTSLIVFDIDLRLGIRNIFY